MLKFHFNDLLEFPLFFTIETQMRTQYKGQNKTLFKGTSEYSFPLPKDEILNIEYNEGNEIDIFGFQCEK